MKEFNLEPTQDTLHINCTSGKISLTGNSILPDPKVFFQPVMDWVEEYLKDPAEMTEVILKFDYIDTASVQSVFNLIKKLKDIPDFASRVVVNWYFEFDDPELLEVGEIMEGRLGIKFNFIEYNH